MDSRDSSVRGFLTEAMAALSNSADSARGRQTCHFYHRQIQNLEANGGKASKIIARRRRRRNQIAKASRRRNRAA